MCIKVIFTFGINRLIQCRISDGLLLFITDIPEMVVEEPQEKDTPVLQESSNGEQTPNDSTQGLKSVLSAGKNQNSGLDGSERPVVTFKENIKPREQSREQNRNQHQRDAGKDRAAFNKGNGIQGKTEQKKEGKRKSEVKKNSHDKTTDAGKQVRENQTGSCASFCCVIVIQMCTHLNCPFFCYKVKTQTEMRKTPVSEARKTPVTQTQTTCSSQFIPIHHPGAFPPLPSRPGTLRHFHTFHT